jgi:hypothetical protein
MNFFFDMALCHLLWPTTCTVHATYVLHIMASVSHVTHVTRMGLKSNFPNALQKSAPQLL